MSFIHSANVINHAINEHNVISRINDTLETNEVEREALDKWLDNNVRNEDIPDYIWDIVNAVYHNSEDIAIAQ